MRINDILKLSVKALTNRKLRAVLTIIGIAIGPMALLMISSVVYGYGKYIVTSITGLGQNLVIVTPASGYKLSMEDVNYLSQLPGVIAVTPFYTTQGEISVGGKQKIINVYGADPSFVLKAISTLKVKEGYVPEPSEIGRALVGYNIVYGDNGERYYELNDVLTVSVARFKTGGVGRIEVKRLNLVIVGVLDKFGGAVFLNPDQGILVSIETLERTLDIKEWNGILVLVDSPSNVDPVSNTIKSIYRNSVDVVSFLMIARTVANVVSAVDFISFAASTSAFAVAIAGVAASMITSVMERTKEIGVMKALGFKDTHVLILILAEGIVMSIIGYVVGGTMGLIGAGILSRHGLQLGEFMLIEAKPEFPPELIARSFIMTISVGVVGGLFPAYRAMKIPPAVALKYE